MATYDRLRRATSINHDVTMMSIGILRLGVNSTVALVRRRTEHCPAEKCSSKWYAHDGDDTWPCWSNSL